MTSTDPKPAAGLPRDLLPRLASGLILAAAALALTWASLHTFAVLVTAVGLIVAWEWGRIVRKAGADTILAVHLIATFAAGLLAFSGFTMLGVLAAIVGAIIAAILGFGGTGPVSALGVLYTAMPVISLIWIRRGSHYGFEAALFVLMTVWAADTGAYFAGRTIGGPKLYPRISPNKTWSGAIGGILASVAIAVLFKLAMPALATLPLVCGAIALAIVSQTGDLLESAMKRRYEVKDASGLIPGHGGFMDRVDGLIFAAVAAALFALIVNVHAPARAILTWV